MKVEIIEVENNGSFGDFEVVYSSKTLAGKAWSVSGGFYQTREQARAARTSKTPEQNKAIKEAAEVAVKLAGAVA